MRLIGMLALAGMIAGMPGQASAQDVVIFRSRIAEPNRQAPTPTPTPTSPDQLILNGTIEDDTAGWVFDGDVVRNCGTGSSGCWLRARSIGASLSYTTPNPALAGTTYALSFSYGNESVLGNFANSTWKLTDGSTTLLSGTISTSGRIGSVRNFGAFVGTGRPVTLSVTRTRSDSQPIGYDDFSILRQ
jgi:hypothetical protein